MIYLTNSKLLKGMILAKPIFNSQGIVILNDGEVLDEWRIAKLKELKVSGVYIKEPEINRPENINADIISKNIRKQTLTQVRATFDEVAKQGQLEKDKLKNIIDVVNDVLNQLLSYSNLVLNINDIKIFDEYVYFHSVNVMIESLILGIGMKLSKDDLSKLGLAAILHDLGKILIPEEILNKPGRLTDEEFSIIKQHSALGYELLKTHINVPDEVKIGILDHHERFDGFGYGSSKKGNEISLFGRIITVADVYDALTSERIYREPMLPSDAISYIMMNSGVMFDPDIVKLFVKLIVPYPIGTLVKLSNNFIGIVLENNYNNSSRPVIRIMSDNKGIHKDYRIDLAKDKEYGTVHIKSIIKNKK